MRTPTKKTPAKAKAKAEIATPQKTTLTPTLQIVGTVLKSLAASAGSSHASVVKSLGSVAKEMAAEDR